MKRNRNKRWFPAVVCNEVCNILSDAVQDKNEHFSGWCCLQRQWLKNLNWILLCICDFLSGASDCRDNKWQFLLHISMKTIPRSCQPSQLSPAARNKLLIGVTKTFDKMDVEKWHQTQKFQPQLLLACKLAFTERPSFRKKCLKNFKFSSFRDFLYWT